ncbi:MAG: TerB family tellurite resistance protein [Flavobacteriaceae bacterium]
MSISDLYSSGFKTRNRDHFAAIVRVALSDNIITAEEEAFIKRLAIFLEIEEEEVATIISDPDKYPINPPANETRRLERLYDLTRMVYADQIADDSEKALLQRLVVGLGFDASEAEKVVEKALSLVQEGKDEDEFIAAF